MLGNFIACLDAVLPIFLLLLLGYWAQCLGLLNRDDVKQLNKVMFRFFMPVMLFYNVYSSDLSLAVQPKLILYALVCTLLIFLLALPAVSRWEPVRSRRGVIVQGLFRSNVVVIGLPVVESLMGAENVAPVVLLIATVVPSSPRTALRSSVMVMPAQSVPSTETNTSSTLTPAWNAGPPGTTSITRTTFSSSTCTVTPIPT